jgi:hypothetical protein
MNPQLLTAWHAVPVTQATAKQQLVTIRHQLKHARDDYRSLRITEIQARYWAGRDISGDIDNLLASVNTAPEQAYLHLYYGQLLMSCKLTGAMQSLDLGFNLAATSFVKADYLIVMRRHQALRSLVLSAQASPPMTLNELLQEAAVINQLKGDSRITRSGDTSHHDTVG